MNVDGAIALVVRGAICTHLALVKAAFGARNVKLVNKLLARYILVQKSLVITEITFDKVLNKGACDEYRVHS